MGSYVSVRGKTSALTVMVGLQVLCLVAMEGAKLVGNASATSGALSAYALLRVASTVVFLMWVYNATSNLTALGSMNDQISPEWAVGWYFVPIANLWMGYRVMANIWRESQPVGLDERGMPIAPRMAIVGWWWGSYLLSSLGRSSLELLAVFEIPAAILFVIMLRATQQRQDAQWDDLQRRQDVPMPTADLLR